MIKPDGQILVIFGASGDLTKRKLLPSLYELFARDMLPENFVILGVARTPFSDEEFRIQQKDNLKAFLKGKHPEAKRQKKEVGGGLSSRNLSGAVWKRHKH